MATVYQVSAAEMAALRHASLRAAMRGWWNADPDLGARELIRETAMVLGLPLERVKRDSAHLQLQIVDQCHQQLHRLRGANGVCEF